MPNPLAITLHASGAETATGSGPVVDLTDRSFAQLAINVTVITGTATPTIVFTVEHSLAQTDWSLLAQGPTITSASTKTLTLTGAYRYIRVRWVITGTTPSFTFAVTGTAHQLYCEPSDITTHGIPKPAVANVPVEQLAEKCLSASDEASGYLASAYKLPLVAWDNATRKHVARMATYELMSSRGYKADSGKDDQIRQGYDDALKWFNRIASGGLRPVGIIDTEPEVLEPEVWVASGSTRGWTFP